MKNPLIKEDGSFCKTNWSNQITVFKPNTFSKRGIPFSELVPVTNLKREYLSMLKRDDNLAFELNNNILRKTGCYSKNRISIRSYKKFNLPA